MHIHILGICGTFMAGIALIARAAGHRVTGCDAQVYPPMSTQLAQAGIDIVPGYGAEQLAVAPDLWVVGNVVSRGNPLMEAILNAGAPYASGPQWLADTALRGRTVVAVAGTHGKTTTTAMLAWLLEAAGRRPGFLIGGVPENFGVSARLTDSPLFVIEADEYDTAFFDKRSKFLHYRPSVAVLNNLEYDHADIFPDLAAIETQFHHLVRTVPGNGRLVVNGAEPALARVLARGCWTPVESFGPGSDWAVGACFEDGFMVRRAGRDLGRVRWPLLGAHNRSNALAALAAAAALGVDPASLLEALGDFRNVKRRLELRGCAGGVSVYDDFAHHPTAIAATVEGLRSRVGGARILAVLEPRSNTMKLGVMKQALAASLSAADQVFCYAGGLEWDPAGALESLGARASVQADFERLLAAIIAAARPGDHVLVMSNGGFQGIHERLLAQLGQLAAAKAGAAR
jgi:UDP-N-acetylmuramate: L-alanyl-gamma-D-glutamyl-meso-diaminopimelate ligase